MLLCNSALNYSECLVLACVFGDNEDSIYKLVNQMSCPGGIMDYLLLLMAILLFSIQTISFKEFNRSFMKNLNNYFLFNFSYFSLVVLILLAFNREFEGLSPITLVLGLSFAAVFILTMLLYMKAMENGPLAYSSLLFSFGIVVPVIFGIFFWQEAALLIQIGGLLLLLLTLVISNRQEGSAGKPVSLRWFVFAGTAMLGNGALMTLSKAHQMAMPGQEVEEFLILAFAAAAVFSLLIFFFRQRRNKEALVHLRSQRLGLLVLVAAFTTAFGNQIQLTLSGRLPAIIQFPMVNGGTVIMATIFAVLLYREKLTRSSTVGLVLGLAALVMLSQR